MSTTCSDLSHFGVDRTNASQSAPRPSKRAPAGNPIPSTSSRTQTPTVPGMNHNAPAFVPPGSGAASTVVESSAAAVWGTPHGHVGGSASAGPTSTPPQSQSPVGGDGVPSPSTLPTAAQLEGFKSMVLQMAQFFQQYPEANVVPAQMGNIFSQMSLTSTTGAAPAGSTPSPHRHTPTAMPHTSFPQQPFEFMSSHNAAQSSDANLNAPYTVSQSSPQRQQQQPPVDSADVLPAAFAAPKPNRRVFAQAQQHPLPSYDAALDPLMSAFQPTVADAAMMENTTAPPAHTFHHQHHNHQSNGLQQHHRGGQRPGNRGRNGGTRTTQGGGAFALQTPDTEPKIIVLVEFKRQRMKKYESDVFVAPGHYVVVEGDRGVDCGFVIHCCIREPDGSFSRQESIDNVQIDVNRIKSESGRVLRLARDDDVKLLHTEIASSELLALKTCRELAARMNLSMEIVDCEYQFDRKKISFYFDAPHSVDFRELNTELFRVFGVRIWLENLNSKVKNVVPDGALSHADKLQYTKNGLRPPRRT